MSRALAVLVGFTLGAPASADDIVLQARHVLQTRCAGCHRGEDWKHLGLADVGRFEGIKQRGMMDQIAELARDGSMPPTGPKLNAAEVAALQAWAKRGDQGRFPIAFDDDYFLQEVADDIAKQPAPDDVRYVILPPATVGAGLPTLEQERAGLALMFPNAFTSADPSGTLLRFDLKASGWDERRFVRGVYQQGKNNPSFDGPGAFNAYDMLLLEYPMGRLHPGQESYDRLKASYLKKLARPFAFVRGDWLLWAMQQPAWRAELAKFLPDAVPAVRGAAWPMPKVAPDEAWLPPIDGVLSPTWPPADKPFELTVALVNVDNEPLKEIRDGMSAKLKLESKANLHVEVVWIDAENTVDRMTIERPIRVAGEAFFGEPAPVNHTGDGNERIVAWASESNLKDDQGTPYQWKSGEKTYQRLVHPVPDAMRENGNPTPPFQRGKIVKVTLPVKLEKNPNK